MPSGVRSRLARATRYHRRRLIPRAVQAAWHHAVALLREFRIPIFGFILLTVVGGFIYGELYEALRGQAMPLIDRPYVIVQLMILEASEAVPPEAALVAFWYVMPVAFVLLVALGAADFVNLVFNRDEQRNPWSEALALTYQNHGIVFGAGHVGQLVIRDLVSMGLDVVAIDQAHKPRVEEHLSGMGVPVIRGDGREIATLEKARLDRAVTFVACTGNDQVNMEAIMRVRHANPQVRIVSRMWDRRFAEHLEQFLGVQSVLSSADLAAPVFAGAALGIEITQTMEVGGVEYSTIHLPVADGSFFVGRTVGDLQNDHHLDIVLVKRDSDVHLQPSRDLTVQAGDGLVLFARQEKVLDLVSRNFAGAPN